MAAYPSRDWRRWLCQAIKRARTDLALTQEELAERASLSRTYVGSIERGEHSISFDTLMQILHALGLRPNAFFAGACLDPASPPSPPGTRQPRRRSGLTNLAHLGHGLRFRREHSELSQEDLAEAVGVSRGHLSAIECGSQNPSVELVLRILEVVNHEPAEFFGRIRSASSGKRPSPSQPSAVPPGATNKTR